MFHTSNSKFVLFYYYYFIDTITLKRSRKSVARYVALIDCKRASDFCCYCQLNPRFNVASIKISIRRINCRIDIESTSDVRASYHLVGYLTRICLTVRYHFAKVKWSESSSAANIRKHHLETFKWNGLNHVASKAVVPCTYPWRISLTQPRFAPSELYFTSNNKVTL